MDTNLEKLLKRAGNQNDLPKLSDILNKLENNKNCMVVIDDGLYKNNIITELLHKYISENRKIWLVNSPITLSPFKLYSIKSGLGGGTFSVKSYFDTSETNSPAALWSVDILRNNIDAVCSYDIQNLPEILVIENLDMLGDEYVGPCLEQVILGLPSNIAVIAFIPPVANRKEILNWLTKTRNSSWAELESVNDSDQLLTYLTPDYELIPLLQKKKTATKVKLSIKESSPIKSLAGKYFIMPLMDRLREEDLTPALIILPSKELCNQALQNFPKTRENTSQMLSNPQITAMFDRYPVLKDCDNIVNMLYKHAAVFDSGSHTAWSEMIERLLSLNLIEALFSTMYDAQSLTTRVKSVVFTTSQITLPGAVEPQPVSNIEFHRICRLTETTDTNRGCLVFVNSNEIDITRLKDIKVIPSLNSIKSRFQCNTQALLALAGSTNRIVSKSVMMSLWAEQKPFKDTAPLLEKQRQLEEFIPQAQCRDSHNALSLIQKTQMLKFEIDQCRLKIEKLRKRSQLKDAEKKVSLLQFIIDNFPCSRCVHQTECQGLRYKKIREISNQYEEIIYEMKWSASILEVDLVNETEFLINMALLDSDFKLTPKGKTALQSGCSNPFYVTEFIWNKKDMPWPEEMLIPVSAGFVELSQEETPILVDEFVDESLRFAYDWLDDCIYPVRENLCLNGVVLPEPSLAQSALVRALDNGIGFDAAAQSCRVSVGTVIKLLQKAKYLGKISAV